MNPALFFMIMFLVIMAVVFVQACFMLDDDVKKMRANEERLLQEAEGRL